MTYLRALLMAILTPLLEKNPAKTALVDAPVVFSMSRVIVAAFAIAMFRQIWVHGVAGWPESTLAIAIVIAMPLLAALDKVKPDVVLEFGKTLISRFGVGGVRTIGSLDAREPSPRDDHTRD